MIDPFPNTIDQRYRSHPWNVTPEEARRIQIMLRDRVVPYGTITRLHLVAGADVAYHARTHRMVAGVVVLRYPELDIIESRIVHRHVTFPYIPGLLSFRETPALLDALSQLTHVPDVLFVDGHGLSHPRRFGIACHIGVLIDRPVIGCAKSRLTGWYEEPAPVRGSMTPLYDHHGQIIGSVVRTRDHTRPMFVSIGHRVDLSEAVRLTLLCGKGYRVPEPIRQADLCVERIKRELQPPSPSTQRTCPTSSDSCTNPEDERSITRS